MRVPSTRSLRRRKDVGRSTGHYRAMSFPSFYDAAPRLVVRDPLSEFLGAAEGGVIQYGYSDAVRLAGHSCPTVAGAYLMVVRALRHLYPDAVPERGAIAVLIREHAEKGVAGVMGSVATLLTGASQDTGFKGIGGRFDRRNLLSFGSDIRGTMAFIRADTGAGVEATLDTGIVPIVPAMRDFLRLVLSREATLEEEKDFRRMWQERVRCMLVDHVDDPSLVSLTAWNGRRDA